MDIKIENKDNKTAMFIEADFDQIVAENFGDICQALAKHVDALSDLQNLNYQNAQIENVIATVRSSHDDEDAVEKLSKRFNISAAASQIILRTSITDLGNLFDNDYLDNEIEQCMGHVQTVIWPLFSR